MGLGNLLIGDSLNIISNSRKVLKLDERIPLNGKIQKFKENYKSLYYDLSDEEFDEFYFDVYADNK